MKKLFGAIVVVLGLIALLGSALFFFIIAQFGSSMGALSSVDATTAAQYGLEVSQVQEVANQINMIITMSYVWILAVIVTSLYTIWSGINEIRKK